MPKEERGRVVTWHAERGFGFIRPDDGGEDIFLHASCFGGGDVDIEGEDVYFECDWDDRKGKYRCVRLEFCDRDAPRPMRGGGGGGYRGRGGRDRSYSRGRRDRDRSYSRGNRRDRDRSYSRGHRRSRSRGHDDRRRSRGHKDRGSRSRSGGDRRDD